MNRRLIFFQGLQVFVLAMITCASSAQVSLVADYTAHYGFVEGTDLTGYVTYDVYVSFPNSNYRLTALGGGLQSNPNFTVQLSSDCNFFQHGDGSFFSEEINCADYALSPALEWDSRFAIGSSCSNGIDHLYRVSSESNSLNAWEAGSSTLSLSNTLFFRMPTDGSTQLNSENKILIGRFTTCGNLCLKLGVQYFDNYTGPGSSFQTEVLEACFNNPCIANPISQNAIVIQPGCTTNSQVINLSTGGNFPVTYNLWNTLSNSIVETSISMDGSVFFNAPNAGSFVIHSSDNFGCRDTTNAISILEFVPPSIQLIGHNLNCFEDASGSVDVIGAGGTGLLTELNSLSQVPFSISNLNAGIVNVEVVDENGCLASSEITIDQPTQVQAEIIQLTDLICGNLCEGSITYLTSGGSGNYTCQLLSSGVSEPANGALFNLCGGMDTLLISDEIGCSIVVPFQLNEPEVIAISGEINSPGCDEYFDGEANFVFSGGSGDLHIFIGEGNFELLPQTLLEYQLVNLGIGDISIHVEDDVGCELDSIITVNSTFPSNLILNTSSTAETCFNERDGTAELILQDGNGPFQFLWDDLLAQQTAQASNLVGNTNYKVEVTDINNCVYKRSVFVPLIDGCIFIANALTPNGDGSNDTWVIGGLDGYADAHVQVVNRYGQLVFESNGYSNPWKGTINNEPLPPADYYYVVSYDDSKEPLTGVVSIKYE